MSKPHRITPSQRPARPPRYSGRAHFIGLARPGMRCLAHVLGQRGWFVSGDEPGPRVDGIAAASSGIPRGTQLIVYADDVPADSPLRRRAAQLRLPRFSCSQMIGQLMMGRCGIAVMGQPGAADVVRVTGAALVSAGLDPTVVCQPPAAAEHASRSGKGPVVLVDGGLATRAAQHLPVQLLVLLGGRSAEQLALCRRVPDDGLILVRHEGPAAAEVAGHSAAEVETFGFDPAADWSAEPLGMRSSGPLAYKFRGRRLAEISVEGAPFSPLTVLAAMAVSRRLGVSARSVTRAVRTAARSPAAQAGSQPRTNSTSAA